MGRDLADAFEEARRTFEEADDVLGRALSRIAWEGPEAELTATRNAQPAIFVHSIAAWRVVSARVDSIALAAGHSVGELSAHAAAGTMSFEDALRTVQRRAELMHEAATARPGTMAAVLAAGDVAEQLCDDATLGDSICVPANYNAPAQVVISGDEEAVLRALDLAKGAGTRTVRLAVSGAFHSPLMEPAAMGLAAHLAATTLHAGDFGVVSNVTGSVERDPERVRDLLVQQLTAPVRWTDCMRTMLDEGVRTFLELGPGKVLTGLLRRIDRDVSCTHLGTVADMETFMAGVP